LKFKTNANGVDGAWANDNSAFMNQVAESLSQCVKTSDEFLQAECPICLDEPRVESAVYSEFTLQLAFTLSSTILDDLSL
jgi:hypothetical protein